MKTLYEILGVEKTSTGEEIKKAYKALARRFHPDTNPDDKVAEDKMKEINNAYQTLGDAEKRQEYDMGGKASFAGFDSNNPINEILKSMGFNINIDFQQGGAQTRGNGQQRIQVKQQINISLHNAVFGCDVELDVPSYINCKDCKGIGGNKETCKVCKGAGQTITYLGTMQIPSGCITCNCKGYTLISTCGSCNQEGFKKKTKHIKMKIPAGIQHQSALQINGEKDDRCDVIAVIYVSKHPKITRNGATLFSTETISCIDAMIGAHKMVEVIDGHYNLTIPPGTQHGQQLVINERGGATNNGRANHIILVNIDIPKNLTSEQNKKLKEIRDEMVKN